MDREKQARRKASRLGLMLRKSRIDGTWMVIDPTYNAILAGADVADRRGAHAWPLEWVEEWLEERAAEPTRKSDSNKG